jgi:WD40 repeat protein
MPVRDRQKPEEATAVADAATDNPLHEAGRAPATGRALRKVESADVIWNAIFLGADALALAHQKKVTLHNLIDEAADPVLLVDNAAGANIHSSAASPDGAALCLGDSVGWLAVYDVAVLRAEPLSPPRYEARLGTAIAGVAFSDDGGWLLTMCTSGLVEVRDARAEGLPPLRTLAFRGPRNSQASCFLRCAGGVAVAIGGGTGDITPGAKSEHAGVWRLSADGEEEAATLTELTSFASAAAVRGDGGQVAVGGVDGVVRLYGGEGWAQSGELAEPGDDTSVLSLAYTPDGRWLVVGRQSDAFLVYDVGSGAAVARFAEPAGNLGWVAAVAPAGDVAAVGGYGSKVVTLRELAPSVPPHRWAMGSGSDVLAGAATVGDVVVLAAGNRLEVHNRGGAWRPLALELDATIGCSVGINNPVAVRPGGGHVACVVGLGKVVVCHALPSGAEAFALDHSHIDMGVIDLCWSPDGDLLLVCTGFGSAVFDAAGAKIQVLSDEEQIVWGAAFSTDGAQLATSSDKIFVRDTTTWEVTHTLPMGGACGSPCFDTTSECVAGWVVDDRPAGSVIVHRLDGGVAAQRFPDVNAQGALVFSADGRFLFGAGAGEAQSHHPRFDRMVVLSRATGAEVDWSAALAAMALPPGTLNGLSLAVPVEGVAIAVGHLQIVTGSEFVEVDVGLARRAIGDNAWGYAQLVQLTDQTGPAGAGALMGDAPHCLNIRDDATGNTLLHHCANTRNVAVAAACLATEGAIFIPIANNEGKTALHLAFERREQPLVRVLADNFTPHLNDTMAALLTGVLRTAALAMPEAVLPLLRDIEATVLVEQAIVRTMHHRVELIGLTTSALPSVDIKDLETFESEPSLDPSLDLTPWKGLLPSTDKRATYTPVCFKTLMLAELAGDPRGMSDGSAFHTIVANCDASVFESKLLQYVVQYKFETNVLPMLRRTMLAYIGATLLATAATLASARQLESGWKHDSTYIDAAQWLMVMVELVQLFADGRQLRLTSTYFSSPWNLMGVGASVTLLIGTAGHFQGYSDTVQSFGGLGVALKWFTSIDYLRGFPSTGPLVRMILVITGDVAPFLGVCSIGIVGCASFFAINQPEAGSAFSNFDGIAGSFGPFLAVILALLGSFDIGDYTKKAAVAMFLFFAFFGIILMLNLLIAIMGDSYSMVKESELVQGLHERAKLIVEHELLYPWRQTYCRYLHVAEAVAKDEAAPTAWEGLGGRIKALKRELVAKVDEDRVELGQANANVKLEADVSEVKAGQAEVKTGQAEVKADVMEVKADVAEVKANIEEMKAGQAEVKALLERLVAQSLQNSA